jgi:hypothetical protein
MGSITDYYSGYNIYIISILYPEYFPCSGCIGTKPVNNLYSAVWMRSISNASGAWHHHVLRQSVALLKMNELFMDVDAFRE